MSARDVPIESSYGGVFSIKIFFFQGTFRFAFFDQNLLI